MEFDIDTETNKLNEFVNDKKMPSFINYDSHFSAHLMLCVKVKYLLYILELTHSYPEIEIYLKELLKNFNVTQLNDLNGNNYTILHYMAQHPLNISLNSFEIIINFGINVNSQTKKTKNIPLHLIGHTFLSKFEDNKISKFVENIIGLFVKHGANLNILNYKNNTVLDEIMSCNILSENMKFIIMVLIDFGANNNKSAAYYCRNLLEFVETCRDNNIKPAIKNGIKI